MKRSFDQASKAGMPYRNRKWTVCATMNFTLLKRIAAGPKCNSAFGRLQFWQRTDGNELARLVKVNAFAMGATAMGVWSLE
jgi:hypothetical protein